MLETATRIDVTTACLQADRARFARPRDGPSRGIAQSVQTGSGIAVHLSLQAVPVCHASNYVFIWVKTGLFR